MKRNSDVEIVSGAAAWGAHAARVLFSAARRKPRSTNFSPLPKWLESGHDGLGGPRALPSSALEFQ